MDQKNISWFDLGDINDIPLRGSRRVAMHGVNIGIFRTATDQVFALEDSCPHRGGPLSEGIVHDNCVTCPLHNWVIDLASGEVQGADEGQVNQYPIRIDKGRVCLGVTTPTIAAASH